MAALILRFRYPAAVLLVLLFGLSLDAVPELQFRFSLLPLLEANQEVRREVDALDRELPPQHFDQICLLEWPRRLDRPELAVLEALGGVLEADDRVDEVLSLATVWVIQPGAGVPSVRRFPATLGDRPVYEVARRHPLLMRKLLSADGRSACLMIRARQGVSLGGLLTWLQEFVPAQLDSEVVTRFLGGEVTKRAMQSHMVDDLVGIVTLQLVLFSILLPLLFRSLRGVVLPILSVVVALALGAGAMVCTGTELSLLDLAIPGLVVVIGLCDAVHLLQRFEEAFDGGLGQRDAILEMMHRVGMACLLTSATTAIGFGSLLVAEHGAVREFGLKAAAAVAITFCSVLFVVPIGLSFWRVRRAAPARLPAMHRLGFGRPAFTLCCAALVGVFAVFGASRMVVDSHWLEELPTDDPVVADLRWFEGHFAGVMTLDVVLEGELRDPEVFHAVEAMQDAMLRLDGINAAESYTHWVREAAGQPAELAAADVQRGIALLGLAGDRFPQHVVRRDFARGRVLFRTSDIGTQRFFEISEQLVALADQLPTSVRAKVGGFMAMAHQSSRLIVTTMLTSFVVSMVMITLFLALVYRSPRIALAAAVANALPVAFALGMTGWLGIPLRIGIVMIYSVGLGLAVDDTIHLITRYAQEKRANPQASCRDNLLRAVRTSGAALIVTSAILAAGSLCHLSASYTSLRDVGLLMTTIVLSALVADLFLLPVLIERFMRDRTPSAEGFD